MLVSRHRPRLLALCRHMMNDVGLAQDATQEAILQALLNLDRLRHEEQFGAWLCGIGSNICRRWLHDRAHQTWSWEMLYGRLHVPAPTDDSHSLEEAVEEAELVEQVRRAVADLPAGQRAAVKLFHLSNLTHLETAVALGVRVGTVKTRLHNARQTLRRTLLDVWKEQMMESGDLSRLVRMEITDVRRGRDRATEGRHLVILEEVGGERGLTFWAGAPHGLMLAMLLKQALLLPVPPAPLLLARLVQAAGGRVREVHITKMIDEVIYASILVDLPTGAANLDATWGDAVALALVTNVPIRVEPAVIDTSRALDVYYADKAGMLDASDSEGATEIVARLQADHVAERETIRQAAEHIKSSPG